jgi:hypothetical protein
MLEPLVCEDSSLVRLMETVHSEPGAQVLYQDTVRRGGVLGFFAREVHRVAYVVAGTEQDGFEQDGFEQDGFEQDGFGTAPAAGTAPAPAMPATAAPAMLATAAPDPNPSGRRLLAPQAPVVIRAAGAHRSADSDAPALATGPFAELLDSVDAAEASAHVTPAPDFSSLLRQELAAEPRAARPATPELDFEPARPPASTAARTRSARHRVEPPALAEVSTLRPRAGEQARARLEMLVQLRQVGVPVTLNPGLDAHSKYQALEEILQELPEPAPMPSAGGQVVAIVGESAAALRAARTAARFMRIPASTIVVAGAGEPTELRELAGSTAAAQLRVESLSAALPTIVVLATDGAEVGVEDPWVGEMLAALRPDATWAVVDARWKIEDCHAIVDNLPSVSALVVHSAELSSSPASVWDLDLPLALLDGRRPSTFIWLGMLTRLFGDPMSARHRATA